MAADSVLVNAAFELGKSKIPGDYSDIFNKQYEGLIELNKQRGQAAAVISGAIGSLITQTGKTVAEINYAKKEFNDGYTKMSDDISAALNKETADIFKDGSSQNQSVVDHGSAVINDYKEEIKKLGFGEDPSMKNKKKIKEVYKKLMEFKGKLNKDRAEVMIANELYSEDGVDLHNSHVVRTETGEKDDIASANLQAVAALQRSPRVDQKALGITYFRNKDNDLAIRYPTNIMRGVFSQNQYEKDDEAYLAYKNSNIQSPNSPEYTGPVMNKEEWRNSAEYKKITGTKGGFGMLAQQEYLKESEYETITVKKLNSMIVKKDHTTHNAANALIDESQLASKARDKGTKELMHGDFSRIKQGTYDKYYDIFKSKDASIQYLATNPLTIGYGSAKRTYKQDLAMNQDINVAVIETLGIGSDEFTAEELKDKKISPAELAKHDEAKAIIIEKLTNPQTETERLVAASELAKYWTQHAEAEFNYSRTPPDKVVNKGTDYYSGLLNKDDFSDSLSSEEVKASVPAFGSQEPNLT